MWGQSENWVHVKRRIEMAKNETAKKSLAVLTKAGWEALGRVWASPPVSFVPCALVPTFDLQAELDSNGFGSDEISSMCFYEASILEPAALKPLGMVKAKGWFDLSAGNVLVGHLLGRYEMRSDRLPTRTRVFFQVQLTSSAKIRVRLGEDAMVVEALAGTVVNVNYGVRTRELDVLIDMMRNGAEFDVRLVVRDKVSTRLGGSFWDIGVESSQTKAMDPTLVQQLEDLSWLLRLEAVLEKDEELPKRMKKAMSSYLGSVVGILREKLDRGEV